VGGKFLAGALALGRFGDSVWVAAGGQDAAAARSARDTSARCLEIGIACLRWILMSWFRYGGGVIQHDEGAGGGLQDGRGGLHRQQERPRQGHLGKNRLIVYFY
jgi:hypothetical protein